MEDSVPSATIRSSGGENSLAPLRTFARKGWLIAVALVAAVFLTYRPCWYGGFIWDDESHLSNLPVLQPLGYHLVSIALHAISALLVWRILVQLQIGGGLPGSGIRENSVAGFSTAEFSQIPLQWPLFAAAIFALHPVNVASVAWIGHLKDVLAVTLALVSVLFYLSYERHAGLWRYGLAIGAFLLSTLATGIAVTLPIVLLACAWWQRGRIDRRDLLQVLPFVLIGAVAAGFHVGAHQNVAQGELIRSDGLLSRAAVAGCAMWFYLGKLIWPFDLSPVYPRWNIDDVSLISFLPGLLLLLILAAAWWQRRSWGRPVVMLIVCYVALLLPVLGFVNLDFMRYSLVADHWQYLAMIAPIAVFAGCSAFLARRFLRGPAAALASAALLIGLAILSWNQSEIYGDAETFFATTIDRNRECWLAYSKLGDILLHRGKIDLAIVHCERALELMPDDSEAQFTLAVALTKRDQDDLAIPHFQRAVELKPDDAVARDDLSAALRRRGQVDQAIAQAEKAIAIEPNFAEAQLNLGLALAASGKADSAIGQFQKRWRFSPTISTPNTTSREPCSTKVRRRRLSLIFRKRLRSNPIPPRPNTILRSPCPAATMPTRPLPIFRRRSRSSPTMPKHITISAMFCSGRNSLTRRLPTIERRSKSVRISSRRIATSPRLLPTSETTTPPSSNIKRRWRSNPIMK